MTALHASILAALNAPTATALIVILAAVVGYWVSQLRT